MTRNALTKKQFIVLAAIGIIANATCLFNEIMGTDGTLYATLSKQIAQSNNWFNLYEYGQDWLDKPHLPFWLAAASFKIFGINAFAYKLPSFICFLIAITYCYKLCKRIYDTATAQTAVVIYITALHVAVANFDVRAEGYLTAFIIAATYHLYLALEKKWLAHIIAAAFFAACAMMTKGIFTLITIAGGFVIYWVKTKQWKEFINLKWYLFILLSFIFIAPELYALYTQFDLHPEKIIFGNTHVSGLKFFFWDSQFGRFFNSGPIKGSGDPFFFFHTTLWAFLPWSLLLLFAIAMLFRKRNSSRSRQHESIIAGSTCVTFLLFSLSKFQLPHYIIIVFPHFAMITGGWIINTTGKPLRTFNHIQTILYLFVLASIIWIVVIYPLPLFSWPFILLLLIASITLLYKTTSPTLTILKINTGIAVTIILFLNLIFYPALLQYQSGMMAGKWLNKNYPGKETVMYHHNSINFNFYCNGNIISADNIDSLFNASPQRDSVILFAPLREISHVPAHTANLQILQSFEDFQVSSLTTDFLNHLTRRSELDTFVIAIAKRKQSLH